MRAGNTIRARFVRRRVEAGVTAVVIATALAGGVAFATASSGYIDNGSITFNNGAVGRRCVKADIVDTADNRSAALAGNGSCASGFNVPGGYLGTYANGYRSGAYCGQTGVAYNSGTTSAIAVGAHLCSNPAGLQSFNTVGVGYFYQGPSYPYNNGYVTGNATSPNQSY